MKELSECLRFWAACRRTARRRRIAIVQIRLEGSESTTNSGNVFLRDLLLEYTNAFLIQVAQSTLCNCYHTLQERLSRWLLMARDAVRSNVLLLTHDVIARLLGTRRASITVAAGLIRRAGLIQTGRGQITILDTHG